MARMTIKERRRQRAEAIVQATEFAEQYLAEHPRATAAQVKAATKAELATAGFDIGVIAAILELIMKIIEMFRAK